MRMSLEERTAQLNREYRKRGRRKLWLTVLSLLVVLGTLSGLLLPAFTQEKTAYCGMEEHHHSKDCYETVLVCEQGEAEPHAHSEACFTTVQELICGQEEREAHEHDAACYESSLHLICEQDESDGHQHDGSCFDENGELICMLEESEGHIHSDECYEEEQTLICGQDETEGHIHGDSCRAEKQEIICGFEESEGHKHSESCYEKRLICKKEEHEHSLACYSNPSAVEYEAGWIRTFPTFENETKIERLLAIAASQLGYCESAENYRVLDDGSVQGWTRYGAWYGDPYGDWCAMFVSFCLYYAGIKEDVFPYNSGCTWWVDDLNTRDQFVYASDGFMPLPGDVIFFRDPAIPELAGHVGLVFYVDNESGRIQIIDGNFNDVVGQRSYEVTDQSILGYGILPESLRAEERQEETPTAEETVAVEYPAQVFTAKTDELSVLVEADEGAFPENTTMTVRPVPAEQVLDAVTGVVEGRVTWVQAVDISFYDEDGNEIQPQLPIRVSIRSEQIAEDKKEATEVIHVDENGAAQRVEQSAALPVETAENEIAFETDSFSIYAVVGTVIETNILASDGRNYKITAAFDESAGIPDGAKLAVSEILEVEEAVDGATEYENYLAETRETLGATGPVSYARFFDISIISEGETIQPAPGSKVNVKIELADSESSSLTVVHFGETPEIIDTIAEEGTVSFETGGFSVYAIVDAPDPVPAGGWNTVATLEEFAMYAAEGVYMHHPSGYYFKDTLYNVNNTTRTGILKTVSASTPDAAIDGGAVKYYFEQKGTDNQFVVYCLDGESSENKKYIKQSDNSLFFVDDESTATVFTVSVFPGYTNTFRVEGTDGYFWNMQGGNNGKGFAAFNNATDTNARIQFKFLAETDDDPYGLDSKTFGIAYHNDSASSAALTAEEMTTSGGQQRLKGQDMLMKPDVRDNHDHDGILLVVHDSDIQMWTFDSIEGNRYYITTVVEGDIKYLSIDKGNVTLKSVPDESCVVSATPGTGANAGKWHFTVNDYSLNLPGEAAVGFNAVTGSAEKSWMNLVEKASIDDDAFTLYTARKISVSDTTELNGQGEDKSQVIIYTRIWNDTKKRYEFFAVDHDGRLIPCYDVGDNIEWVGSNVNTALWEFTEYTNTDGTVNYYYELENVQYGNYLAPQLAAGQILSDDTVGINLNGRRYGEAYTTIIAWDDTQYAYSGLKTENGRAVVCPLSEAEDFYFAIVEPAESSSGLTTVDTIDNNEYGITMKMIDFNNGNSGTTTSTRDSVQNPFFGGDNNNPGLLTTNLQDGVYPWTTSLTGHEESLGNLFSNMTDVNHLFLESIYQESGYFEYDSTSNFAYLESNGNFTVYDQLGTISDYNSPTAYHGQFMPYDEIEGRPLCSDNLHRNTTDVLAQELPDTHPRKGEPLYDLGKRSEVDYHFGMEMEASFTQTADGLDAWGHDIIFEFSGDDDFWLYVDGELVLDLGGVHSAMTGSVNFRTGEVKTSNRGNSTLYEIFRSNYQARNLSEDEIAENLERIFQLNDEGNYVFKDYTKHTMKMFYMERGAGASNLHMRFNLASVKPGTIVLSKKLSGAEGSSNNLLEFPYQIWYTRQEDGETIEHLLDDPVCVTYKDSTRPVRYQEQLTITGTSLTYDNVFFLKPGESAVIDLPDDVVNYWIVECGVNTTVYDQVKADGVILSPGEESGEGNFKDFATDCDTMENRPQVDYENHVREGAMRTLSITKWLYNVDGTNRLFYPEDKTPFSFRLYLGNEYSDSLPGANLYPYYVKDANGNYCRWNAEAQQFEAIEPHITEFSALNAYLETCTAVEREAIVFRTSPGGSISKIPADHTVEVRDLVVGTKWKVEERDYEIPRGYTLRLQDGYQRIDVDPWQNTGTTPISDTIRPNEDPETVISNQKGWGLTVQKVWTDKDFMASHDDIYFAVYLRDQQDGSESLLDYTVRQLKHPNTEIYYFFDNEKMGGRAFADFIIYEVSVTTTSGQPLDIDENGTVSMTEDVVVTPIQNGGVLNSGGIPAGSEDHKDYTYSVSYTVGKQTGHNENVRTDTVTNARPGVRLVKKTWGGEPLANAYFTLKDEAGHDVAKTSYRSDADGLITIAYLEIGSYTLTETRTPRGYVGLPESLTITVAGFDERGNPVITVGPDSYLNYFEVVQATDTQMATVTVKNRTVGFQAIKVDAKTRQALPGAHFALYLQVTDNQGHKVKADSPIEGYEDIVSGEGGILPGIDLEHLRKDRSMTYYLCETQPAADHDGLAEDVCFTVGEDGSVSINSSGHETWLAEGTDTTGNMSYVLTIPNERTEKLSFKKVDINNITKTLAGARFALYRVIGGVREGSPIFAGLVSREDGILATSGSQTEFELPIGEYQLVELQPPPGYNRKTDPVTIIVSGAAPPNGISYNEGTNLSTSGEGRSYNETTHVYTLLISNTTGVELPNTGGTGTMPFYIGGSALILTGLLYRFRRRRRERGDVPL